ncbi:MAG: hypothetical protein J7J72_03660 [Bacteroidales bacterium]|nr:hypothetical protein [Bacteroidales bacterium]
MDYREIKTLLEKYLEGESSIQEEDELKRFFNENENIPEELLFAKKLFRFFGDEKTIEYTKEFEHKKPRRKINLYTLSGIAATLLLALFFVFSNYKTKEKIIYAYINGEAITDINIAKEQTKQILYATSQKISTGIESLNRVGDLMNPELLIKK